MAKNEPNKPDDVKTAPPDTGDKQTPAPDEVVVPFDKINEIVAEKKAAA